MKFDLEGLTVYFPYEYIYPEQFQYMVELKHSLDAQGHCLLEMPTGTGKTITLLSLITSYQLAHGDSVGKLIYCTRTVPEMEKVLVELQELIEYRKRYFQDNKEPKIVAVGLSSRKNLCVHPTVSEEGSRESTDAKCMKLTAPWVRERKDQDGVETCAYFEGLEADAALARLDPGVYTLKDMRKIGKQKMWCPYFLARNMIAFANVVVFNYQYMIDPKVSNLVSRELEKECVVVFDEAHNIDNVCIESLSVNIRQQTLDNAGRNLASLRRRIDRMKETDAERLREEYRKLVSGIAGGHTEGMEQYLANPALPDDILREAVPGNIRRAEHFVAFMQRFLLFLRNKMEVGVVVVEDPKMFLRNLEQEVAIDGKTLRFCYDRLVSLMRTLEVSSTDEYTPIHMIADFATLASTYMERGFAIISEPYDDRMPSVPDPIIQLSCLDASLAMKPVFTKFRTVVITSGTLSPIDLYPKILNFHPVALASLNMTLTRDCLCPVVLTRGADQLPVSTKFDMRHDPGVIRNYGRMLVDLSATVPDGIICFFVSYSYMDSIVSAWQGMGILAELMEHKLVFIETQDVVETTLALDNYRRACDCGRGAVFLSVARGKVAEGIDFDRHYGRCVVMFGIPYQYTLSRILRARLEYLKDNFQIKESDYLAFDAIRQAAQCVGRVIRSKADYGLMIFADKRYQRGDKRDKLPKWISDNIKDGNMSLSTDMLITVARDFMREMGQDINDDGMGGLLSAEDLANPTKL
jgi:DNA excision repair protein ERCC-2